MGKKYITPIYVCPKCGQRIEGDMPIISHGILGCNKKLEDKGEA